MMEFFFKLIRKHSAEIGSQTARERNLYQTNSRAGRPPGVHKRAQGSSVDRPVDRSRRTVDRLI